MTPLASAIAEWAPGLHVAEGSGINAVAVLQTLAEIETSGGARWQASKHEPAYCYGGRYHNAQVAHLSYQWGCSAHSSWGPWQIMYITAVENGYEGDPFHLRYPEVSAPLVVAILNKRVMDKLADERVEDIFDAWNSGNPRDSIVPHQYIAKGLSIYHGIYKGA